MFNSILVRFKISRKLAQLVRSSRYTLLVGPDLLAVCPSGWCWCLSTSTGGHHCRGGGHHLYAHHFYAHHWNAHIYDPGPCSWSTHVSMMHISLNVICAYDACSFNHWSCSWAMCVWCMYVLSLILIHVCMMHIYMILDPWRRCLHVSMILASDECAHDAYDSFSV